MRNELDYAHHCLESWAMWTERAQRTCLGYPSSYELDRMPAAGSTPAVPSLMMSPTVALVDKAVRDMPPELARVVEAKYMATGTESQRMRDWCAACGLGRSTYRERLNQALAWVGSRLHDR